jgi:hypothetical protein
MLRIAAAGNLGMGGEKGLQALENYPKNGRGQEARDCSAYV